VIGAGQPGLPLPVAALLGPTASGKSALGLRLAEQLEGEIICCDSMQVYRGMDIGTAKATPAERAAVPHHLLDVVSPAEQFHAAAWAAAARTLVVDINARGRLPIIVGGTGLYFRALVCGLFDAPRPAPEIRARHQAEAAVAGPAALHARLQSIDPESATKIEPGDLVRISRALEVFEQTGKTISELRRTQARPTPSMRVFSLALDFDLSLLRRRIATRVAGMMAAGFLDEVRGLRDSGYRGSRAMQGIGYKQLSEHLDGEGDLARAVVSIESATAAYARRQRTWFRREAISLRLHEPPGAETIVQLLRDWLAA
jgi:tRNA dimethylallyltransferase